MWRGVGPDIVRISAVFLRQGGVYNIRELGVYKRIAQNNGALDCSHADKTMCPFKKIFVLSKLGALKGRLSSPLAVGPPRCHVSAAGSRHRCWDWCCPSRPAAVQVPLSRKPKNWQLQSSALFSAGTESADERHTHTRRIARSMGCFGRLLAAWGVRRLTRQSGARTRIQNSRI